MPLLCGILLKKTKQIPNPGIQIAAKRMLYVATENIFWLDMDKFPGDAAKITDQSESFLLWGKGGGGEFGLSSGVRT